MKRSERKNLAITGIFMSFLLAVFMLFAALIGKENQWLSEKVMVRANVSSANNLREGGIVQLQGLKVGTVENIAIVGQDKVSITMELDAKYLKWIKKDSSVDISSKGLVGDKLIKIISGSETAAAFDPHKDVLSPHPSLATPDIAQTSGEIALQVDRVLSKVEVFLDQINRNDTVYKTLEGMSQASTKLNTLLAGLEKGGFSKKLVSSSENFDKAMKRLNSGPGTLHSLIYEDELYKQLNQIVGGAGRSDILKYFIRRSLDESQEAKQ